MTEFLNGFFDGITTPIGMVVVGLFMVGGGLILGMGLVKLCFIPMSLAFVARERRRAKNNKQLVFESRPRVSIVVPGYNEEVVISNCVESILRSNYEDFEVILVDDGSTDGTARIMDEWAAKDHRVSSISQPNAGKGAALNRGFAASDGEVVLFVDADGVFGEETINEMLKGFNHPSIGAVCGDDRPINLNTVQTRLLTVISHLGTGVVRRALALIGCLPIVSGNSGAFLRSALNVAGNLDERIIGEDLELTWRIHKAGYQVNFAPRALVYAESPSTLRGLWKQRVRWARGLLQTIKIHKSMHGNPRFGAFGFFLVFNTFNMVAMPVIQLLVLLSIPVMFLLGSNPIGDGVWAFLAWLGILVSIALAIYAIALNRAAADLRHLWTIPLWPIYSVLIGLTMLSALFKEITNKPANWNKLDRSGVVSVGR